jgi:hypothetical protein
MTRYITRACQVGLHEECDESNDDGEECRCSCHEGRE